jgi:hypothetical protein
VPKKKLTAAERKLDAAMLAALEYAQRYPKSWIDIGNDETSKAAIALLQARGVVEIQEYSNQFRLKRT